MKRMDGPIKVATSGYFNPIHGGHIDLIRQSKHFGNWLTVIVNNDKQVALKGRVPFMSETERCKIVAAIEGVNEVVLSIDEDLTVNKTLDLIHPDVFCKGGDTKNPSDIPEAETCRHLLIEMEFNVGGEKTQSSSSLIENAIQRTGEKI